MMFRFALLVLILLPTATQAEPSRLTGRIASIDTTESVMLVEDVGDDELTAVDFRTAKVVRVSRDKARPWQWRERSTGLTEWPAGTFVVVIGSVGTRGRVRADRIEIPRADRP